MVDQVPQNVQDSGVLGFVRVERMESYWEDRLSLRCDIAECVQTHACHSGLAMFTNSSATSKFAVSPLLVGEFVRD